MNERSTNRAHLKPTRRGRMQKSIPLFLIVSTSTLSFPNFKTDIVCDPFVLVKSKTHTSLQKCKTILRLQISENIEFK